MRHTNHHQSRPNSKTLGMLQSTIPMGVYLFRHLGQAFGGFSLPFSYSSRRERLVAAEDIAHFERQVHRHK